MTFIALLNDKYYWGVDLLGPSVCDLFLVVCIFSGGGGSVSDGQSLGSEGPGDSRDPRGTEACPEERSSHRMLFP